MLYESLKQLKTALLLLVLLTVLTGILYPGFVTIIAELFFSKEANGSLIPFNHTVVGSQFIGQSFTDPRFFWSRPSATVPFPYNAESSRGSNAGPLNTDYFSQVQKRIEHLKVSDPKHQALIPVDLVTASASGLDPEISLASAEYQVSRVARANRIPEKVVETLIQEVVQYPTLGILGETRVNVLLLNLKLVSLLGRSI